MLDNVVKFSYWKQSEPESSIIDNDILSTIYSFHCSNCGEPYHGRLSKYCSECGNKMIAPEDIEAFNCCPFCSDSNDMCGTITCYSGNIVRQFDGDLAFCPICGRKIE